MLEFLHIENIAVIERSDIEFNEGFNVLTGETGAGKSILIDAINAVLGERTSKDLIRAGCDEAVVSAVFGNLSSQTVEELRKFDIEPDEDGKILISRKLSLTSKGYIKINSVAYTASVLRQIAGVLINIHGQHDNQALLDVERHCSFIDAVAENEDIISCYREEFSKLNRIIKELKVLQSEQSEKQNKTELLEYQIKELENADIKAGEIAELKKRLAVAESYENTVKSLNAANSFLYGDDDTDGAISLLTKAAKQLSLIKSNDFDKNTSKLNDIISLTQDIASDISSALYTTENEEYDADSINQRLDYLYRLMLKYGNSEDEMLSFLAIARKQLQDITFSGERIETLENELDISKERLVEIGAKLTKSRIDAAEKFSEDVCGVLSYLNMPNVKFSTEINQGRYTKNGCDEVQFMLSANAGETLKPLSKIASGGELSRVMLSIKSCLLDKDDMPTMIFDEIDTGISGFAADKVANQLKKVSKNRQVICVTHLAQIASAADNHLLIEKNTDQGRTFTKVSPLDYEGRIGEIARIMSGTEITQNLYNSAKELLDRSFKNENL